MGSTSSWHSLGSLRACVVASALALGCQPQIGSACNLSTDCSQAGDRLCDTSQPFGYCTIFNCGANSCPGEAACVATSPAEVGCPYDDRHSPSRFSRQMCLRVCNSPGDCRDGYDCLVPDDVGALLLDSVRNKKVCLPKTSYSVSDAAPDVLSPVCSVSGPDVPPIDAGPGFEPDASDASSQDAATDAADAEVDAGSGDAASE